MGIMGLNRIDWIIGRSMTEAKRFYKAMPALHRKKLSTVNEIIFRTSKITAKAYETTNKDHNAVETGARTRN